MTCPQTQRLPLTHPTSPDLPGQESLIPRKGRSGGWLWGELLPACSRMFRRLIWCGKYCSCACALQGRPPQLWDPGPIVSPL